MKAQQHRDVSHYERLEKSLTLLRLRASSVNNTYVQLASNKDVVIEQAIMNYRTSSAIISMMEEVIRCAKLLKNDATSRPLIRYMEQHIPEETGHDQWCLDDLNVLGVTQEQIESRLPSPNVAALLGTQYYLIRHCHPVAIMGYLVALETSPPTEDYVNSLIKKSELPSEAFNCLMHHAKIDPYHTQDIIKTINSLPLTERQFQIIERSAFQSLRYVALMMEEVCRAAPKADIAV